MIGCVLQLFPLLLCFFARLGLPLCGTLLGYLLAFPEPVCCQFVLQLPSAICSPYALYSLGSNPISSNRWSSGISPFSTSANRSLSALPSFEPPSLSSRSSSDFELFDLAKHCVCGRGDCVICGHISIQLTFFAADMNSKYLCPLHRPQERPYASWRRHN